MWWWDQPWPLETGQKHGAGREQGPSELLLAEGNLQVGQSQEESCAQGTHTLGISPHTPLLRGLLHQYWDEKQLAWVGVSAASVSRIVAGLNSH